MDALFLISRIALALVFAVSSIAKLVDRRGSRRAMRSFGVPASLSGAAALALPLAELALAALLIPVGTAWWGAVGALLMLLAFTGAVGYQLARGRRPECHCFGALADGRIGSGTLIRNGILAALALGIAIRSWDDALLPGVVSSEPAMASAVLLLGTALVLVAGAQAAMIYAVYRRLSTQFVGLQTQVTASRERARRREAGELVPPVIGEPAPVIELPGLDGNPFDLAAMGGREVLLMFVRPGCGACHAILPDLAARAAPQSANDAQLVVVTRGAPSDNDDLSNLDVPVLLSSNASVAAAFGVGGTPAALVLDGEGRVASDIAIGTARVRVMLAPGSEQPQGVRPEARRGWREGLTASTQRVIAMVRSSGA